MLMQRMVQTAHSWGPYSTSFHPKTNLCRYLLFMQFDLNAGNLWNHHFDTVRSKSF